MAIRPEEAGRNYVPPSQDLEPLVRDMERDIDRRLRSHPAGEPFRMSFPDVDHFSVVLPKLVDRYRRAGWSRARVEPNGHRCWLVIEP